MKTTDTYFNARKISSPGQTSCAETNASIILIYVICHLFSSILYYFVNKVIAIAEKLKDKFSERRYRDITRDN
jgi:hypothetical protein